MAHYNYKDVRNILIKEGYLDEYVDPVDKEKYGETLSVGLDGNIWSILTDYLISVDKESGKD